MGTRSNALDTPADLNSYLDGCVGLSQQQTGLTAADVDQWARAQAVPNWHMRGAGAAQISWWDYFVLWHWVATSYRTGAGSNRAHGGPIFLPWHRMFLRRLEEVLQIVLGEPDFGLPYWDWARDRALGSPLWTWSRLGTNRGTIDRGRLEDFRVTLLGTWTRDFGVFLLAEEPREIRREAGRGVSLPTKAEVRACMNEGRYDASTWDSDAADGLRNRLEGFATGQTSMHNVVHGWVGGDMEPMTSPNDPVFYLNHCNVDRIWEAWMQMPAHGRAYRPNGGNDGNELGHNLNDPMISIYGPASTPADTLDMTGPYDYDTLGVAD